MKKTLIAIAALAATGAFAQSTVTIDGGVDAGYVSYDYKGQKTSGVDRNLTYTSQFNLRANTDLGGGMRATWRGETDFIPTSFNANNGIATAAAPGTFLNGEQKLALSGGFGEIAFGAINNQALNAHGTAQPFGTAIGSGFRVTSGSAVTGAVRNDNTMQYTSPAIGGGLKLNAIVRKAQNGTATAATVNANLGAQQQAGVMSLSAAYNAGPLNAVLTRDVEDNTTNAGNRSTFTAMAANYNLGATTVYGGWQSNKAVNGAGASQTERSALVLGAKYTMGVNTFMAAYHRATSTVAAAAAVSLSSNLVGLGYEYALSKTAAITARYERIGDSAGFAAQPNGIAAAVAGNNDRTRMGVGLRLTF